MQANAGQNNGLRECPSCRGRKHILGMGERICDGCAGTGRDLREDLYAGPCRKCNGKGRVTYCENRICGTCRGLGKIF